MTIEELRELISEMKEDAEKEKDKAWEEACGYKGDERFVIEHLNYIKGTYTGMAIAYEEVIELIDGADEK